MPIIIMDENGTRKCRRRRSISSKYCCLANYSHRIKMHHAQKHILFLTMMVVCIGRSVALMTAAPFLHYGNHQGERVSSRTTNGSCVGCKEIRHELLYRSVRRTSAYVRPLNSAGTTSSSESSFQEDFDEDGYPTTDAKVSGEDEDDVDADEYVGRFISEAIKELGGDADEGIANTKTPKKGSSNSKDLDSSESSAPSDDQTLLDETKHMIEQQQQQIDLLMKLVQGRQPLSPPSKSDPPSTDRVTTDATQSSPISSATSAQLQQQFSAPTVQQKSINVAPLKAMLFVDGTWLYYSLNTRNPHRDAIIPKFGKGWQNNYKVNWLALPRLICAEMEKQRNSKTSFSGSDRPLEISRVMVFTSAKKETDPNSIRMRMFREMANANFDVHMMETVGQGEKCVDIQLAVEMLHYATVPNAYDVAILLSGDKDFVPALVRTRQKGKQVCISSMRAGCNRVLYESPHIRDYDVVWLENFLDDLIVPIPPEERSRRDRAGYASAFTMMRVVRDFVESSPDHEWTSSRDIGKYLKSIEIADSNMLEELKQAHGGLRTFLMERACNLFDVQFPEAGAIRGRGEFGFWVRAKGDSDETLLNEFKRTQFFTKEEKQFLESYMKGKYIENDSYKHTATTANYIDVGNSDAAEELGGDHNLNSSDGIAPPALDYSQFTVVRLKELCREKGLPVSGKKDVLVDRLDHDRKIECEVIEKQRRETLMRSHRTAKKTSRATVMATRSVSSPADSTQSGNIYSQALPQMDASRYRSPRASASEDPIVGAHLEALVEEYLTASGGTAGSRDIGRYLAANGDSQKGEPVSFD